MEGLYATLGTILVLAALVLVRTAVKHYAEKNHAIYDDNRSRKLKAIVEAVQTTVQYAIQNEVRKLQLEDPNTSFGTQETRATVIAGAIKAVEEVTEHDIKSYLEKHLTPSWDKWLTMQVELISSTVEQNIQAAQDAEMQRQMMFANR